MKSSVILELKRIEEEIEPENAPKKTMWKIKIEEEKDEDDEKEDHNEKAQRLLKEIEYAQGNLADKVNAFVTFIKKVNYGWKYDQFY